MCILDHALNNLQVVDDKTKRYMAHHSAGEIDAAVAKIKATGGVLEYPYEPVGGWMYTYPIQDDPDAHAVAISIPPRASWNIRRYNFYVYEFAPMSIAEVRLLCAQISDAFAAASKWDNIL